MKTLTRTQFAVSVLLGGSISSIGCASSADRTTVSSADSWSVVDANTLVIESDPSIPRPPFVFSKNDEKLLDEIQHATFVYFWNAVAPETGMVYDRTSSDVVSVAGVGFQLAALPIGVERGWVSKEDAEARTRLIIDSLSDAPSNRKAGLFYHFINPHDASARRVGRELVVSTVDSALLFSGMIVAGEYFKGDLKRDIDALVEAADWSFFLETPGGEAPDAPFLSLGWKPSADEVPTGDGSLLPFYWIDSGDEHRLSTLLGVCAPDPDHRVPVSTYWHLRRQIGYHEGQGYVSWFPYSGALFTAFFEHLFVDRASMGMDDPSAHGVSQRAKIDWWENSRRLVNLHRDRAIENPLGLPTLSAHAWGFSASDGPEGYLVSAQYPSKVTMRGARVNLDFANWDPQENWGDGVVAPYAPGTSIMFEPTYAVEALRFARSLEGSDGEPGVWRGDWGFADAYRLGEDGKTDWVAEDYVAISQGPLILGIENARSGLIWELFMSSEVIRSGMARLGE